MNPRTTKLLLALGMLLVPVAAEANKPTLRGSDASMRRQHAAARDADYTFLRTPAEVLSFVADGRLIPVPGNANYRLERVEFPYARPVVRVFLERLGAQYRDACGEQLVVTSLTRPLSDQPNNASPLSVHPAGMAVDLRSTARPACSQWLEATLLALETRGLLDVTRERAPPHFHVAVFPGAYGDYLVGLLTDSVRSASEAEGAQVERVRRAELAAAAATAGGGSLKRAGMATTESRDARPPRLSLLGMLLTLVTMILVPVQRLRSGRSARRASLSSGE